MADPVGNTTLPMEHITTFEQAQQIILEDQSNKHDTYSGVLETKCGAIISGYCTPHTFGIYNIKHFMLLIFYAK